MSAAHELRKTPGLDPRVSGVRAGGWDALDVLLEQLADTSAAHDPSYVRGMPGTPPDPGIELLPIDSLVTNDRVIPWSDLLDGPNGGKLLPTVERGARVLFQGPDGATWAAARDVEGLVTLSAPLGAAKPTS